MREGEWTVAVSAPALRSWRGWLCSWDSVSGVVVAMGVLPAQVLGDLFAKARLFRYALYLASRIARISRKSLSGVVAVSRVLGAVKHDFFKFACDITC